MLKIGENFKRLRKSLEFNVTEICSEKSKQNKVYKFENSSSSPRIFTVKEILGFLGIQKMSSFFFYCQEDLTFQEVQKVQEKKVSKTAWTYLSKLNQSNAFRYEYSYEDIVIHLSRINEFDENNLADTAIVSPGTAKSFFNEKRVNRSCQILEKICKAFSIELWEFFWIIESLEAIKETRKKEKEKKRSPKLSGTLSLDFGEKKSERETSTSHKKIEEKHEQKNTDNVQPIEEADSEADKSFREGDIPSHSTQNLNKDEIFGNTFENNNYFDPWKNLREKPDHAGLILDPKSKTVMKKEWLVSPIKSGDRVRLRPDKYHYEDIKYGRILSISLDGEEVTVKWNDGTQQTVGMNHIETYS